MNQHQSEIIEKARELRQQKLSFQEISRALNIPSTTIRNWCYDLGIDRHESLRINNEYRRKLVRSMDVSIVPTVGNITVEQARLFAALLYGCEGCKYPATTSLTFVNSDPKLIKIFIDLLRKGFHIDEGKFRVHLQIHNYHNFEKIREFWSKLLAIPTHQFFKPTITAPRGKMRRQNYVGTCSLRYWDNRIQLRLLGIFDKFCDNGEVA